VDRWKAWTMMLVVDGVIESFVEDQASFGARELCFWLLGVDSDGMFRDGNSLGDGS